MSLRVVQSVPTEVILLKIDVFSSKLHLKGGLVRPPKRMMGEKVSIWEAAEFFCVFNKKRIKTIGAKSNS